MPRLQLRVLLALPFALAALGGGSASAAEPVLSAPTTVLDARLAAPAGTHTAACHAAYRPGRAGVATRSVRLGAPGSVKVTLAGDAGDWDVAVFDAAGKLLTADASPDAQETASGIAVEAGTLHVQACRRTGTADAAAVTLAHAALRPSARGAKLERPKLVSVIVPTRAQRDQLLALGLDMTEHGGRESLGVVLHGAEDEAALRKAGLRWRVLVPDLIEQSRAQRAGDRRFAARAAAAAVPSGRTTYRTLADYNAEMKALAEQNPALVRLITLPNKTYGGKDVLGIEITTDVNVANGKPAFLNMGVHHAREWPSGEHAMEWAYELINGFKGGNARATNIVRNSRNIVVPIVNPDGFEASRNAAGAPDEGRDEAVDDTAYLIAGTATGGEYRRKNCRLPDDSEAGNCATSAGLAENGVDPNRNYGGLWGGPGADTNPLTQSYRGPGPFSEPESRNVQWLVSHNQVATLITNHTTAGLVLRAPGLAMLGDPVDENRGYKALGDEMAKHNGYFSQKSFELYDTTGTTEDWSYNSTGGFGFTFEIYCGAPNYETGDCDDPAFHPLYETMVKEWEGTSPQADHVGDPGPNAGFDGQGNREAYYLAAESTLNEQRHSVLAGSAPAGATLRLTKQFKTATFPQPPDDQPILFDDKLETTYDVPASGTFRWHVNPSTRPIVAKETGVPDAGEPSPPESQSGGVAGSSTTGDDPDDGAAVPTGDANSNDTVSYNDHPITVPSEGDNATMDVKVSWTSLTGDWDAKLYEDLNGDGKSQDDEPVVSSSQTGPSNIEQMSASGTPRLPAGKRYVLRVNNFAATAVDQYEVEITFSAPPPFKPAQVESYTLTCEQGGRVFETQQVQVDRGQVKQLDLSACARAIAAAAGQGGAAQPPAGGGGPSACAANAGFRSASVRPRGGGAVLGFRRQARRPVTVDVFQQSRGRRVTGERLVARFANRSRAVRWNGKANRSGRRVTDGYYFARFRMRTAAGTETRRITVRRSDGRFSRRPGFYRRATCDLLPSYKLERPVFGGTTAKPLRIAYRVARRARVQVTVLRGKRVVKRFATRTAQANRTHRLRLGAKGLRRGDHRVRLSVRAGAQRLTSTLVSRRL